MADTVTPMMRQYRRMKAEIAPGVILFFRLGDFYEMFYEDAKIAAPILDITLTRRNDVPMCGVPFHALESYLSKLIRANMKVAICEQVEDASATKGIVRREIARIVTPGTIVEDNVLESNRHNFLCGIYRSGDLYGLAALDLSTGLFEGEEFSDEGTLRDALRRISPSECIMASVQAEDENRGLAGVMGGTWPFQISICEDWTFEYDVARDHLVRHFDVQSLEGFGCEGRNAAVGAAGAVFYYVKNDLRRHMGHIHGFRLRESKDFLVLDEAACGNLNLIPERGPGVSMSLLQVLDVTKTAMGGRMLRDWILRPLADLDALEARHDAVDAFCEDRSLLAKTRDALGKVRDLERITARISSSGGNGRDLQAVGSSLSCLPEVKTLFAGHSSRLLGELGVSLELFPELVDLVERAITDEPPVAVKDGGVIRDGYNAQLDDLRGAASQGRTWLAEYQAAEQERTGIKNIKVRHNKVFGYYIEISKGQLSNVPDDYTRKQTLVNAERFITPELKEYEHKIFNAHDKSVALEYELLAEVRNRVVGETLRIQSAAASVARLDVLSALADRALALRYVRPLVTKDNVLRIKSGRHPVVEQVPDAEKFVPNDTLLDCVDNQLIIITGPNMAGKSTYIRQVAMLVIMAQMGSFVPADEAEIGLVDRVFTRVGASDDLTRGRSTFMVEMEETANILNNATPRSLIVLDEIGRGTSTFDGISIAWAVAEFLHNNENVKAKTLFATHYHELTDLALTMSGVKNYNILVREKDDKVVFLRRIEQGGADKSYGIQVARLAGMPVEVVDRSKEVLANLEEGEFADTGQPKIAKKRARKEKDDSSQLNLL